jgi:hypothetical protein
VKKKAWRQQWQRQKQEGQRKRQRTGKGAKERRRERRAGLQARQPCSKTERSGKAKLEAALAKALQRIPELKAFKLKAARSEAWLQKFNAIITGLGSAAKPTTRVQEAAATPPPPEPGRDDGGDEELDKKTETETVKRVAGMRGYLGHM